MIVCTLFLLNWLYILNHSYDLNIIKNYILTKDQINFLIIKFNLTYFIFQMYLNSLNTNPINLSLVIIMC